MLPNAKVQEWETLMADFSSSPGEHAGTVVDGDGACFRLTEQ